MNRVMRDSTRATDIPSGGTDLVAGYVNGAYKWLGTGWARFPHIPHVHIDVLGTDPLGAGVLDVETGDASVRTAVEWARTRHAAGHTAVIYCNRATLTPLFNAMDAGGLRIGHEFKLWIATLDGTKTVPDMTGVVAVQYAGEKLTGAHYDESAVYDPAWHPAPVPPAPVPVPVAERFGYLVPTDPPGAPFLAAQRPVTAGDVGKPAWF